MDNQSQWRSRARNVAYVQAINLGAAIAFIPLLVVESFMVFGSQQSLKIMIELNGGRQEIGVDQTALLVMIEVAKFALCITVAISIMAIFALFESLKRDVHPLIALQKAYFWRNVNLSFISMDGAVFVLLINPFATSFPNFSIVLIFFATMISIECAFVLIVCKFIKELEVAVTTTSILACEHTTFPTKTYGCEV